MLNQPNLDKPVLLVGLGNPGERYKATRHNAGYICSDYLVQAANLQRASGPVQGDLWRGTWKDAKLFVFRSSEYMNLCGLSIGKIARYFDIPANNLIVMHDELDLQLGQVRCKFSGGNAGHNGLKSISAHFNSDCYRLRIGIGHPGNKEQVVSHVLGKFTSEEFDTLNNILPDVVQVIPLLWQQGLNEFSQKLGTISVK